MEAMLASQSTRKIEKRIAAFVTPVSAGSSMALYAAFVGFYVKQFKGRGFFISMMLAAYAPYPLTCALQSHIDNFLEKKCSCRTLYFFRVGIMQLFLGVLGIVWCLMPQKPSNVLMLGAVLGTMCATLTTSNFQLVAAMEPGLITYLQVGNQVGAVLPVLVFYILDFHPSVSIFRFQLAIISAVVIVCLCSFALLLYLHCTKLFDDAYSCLAFSGATKDERNPNRQFGSAAGSEGTLEASRNSIDISESTPLFPCAGATGWIYTWIACGGVNAHLAFTIFPLAPFFGSPSLAQYLSMTKQIVDCSGRLLMLPTASLACFHTGPCHLLLTLGLVTRFLLAGFLLACLSTMWQVPMNIFIVAWCFFHFLFPTLSSLVDVTVATYSGVEERRELMRQNVFSVFSGVIFGLLTATAILLHIFEEGSLYPEDH